MSGGAQKRSLQQSVFETEINQPDPNKVLAAKSSMQGSEMDQDNMEENYYGEESRGSKHQRLADPSPGLQGHVPAAPSNLAAGTDATLDDLLRAIQRNEEGWGEETSRTSSRYVSIG